ncbi:EthD family reductase [Candidatus Bathyarchaeota archaeon]|nr:EthD family reductase [Candidatus Bathyarchaeota archaeon]
MATLTALYPNTPDARYDVDYYINIHMPLVQQHWKQYGLLSWSVSSFASDATKPALYSFMSIIHFESTDSIHAALASPERAVVMGDVEKFANTPPLILIAETKASASV